MASSSDIKMMPVKVLINSSSQFGVSRVPMIRSFLRTMKVPKDGVTFPEIILTITDSWYFALRMNLLVFFLESFWTTEETHLLYLKWDVVDFHKAINCSEWLTHGVTIENDLI